jgi:TolA-binding protein
LPTVKDLGVIAASIFFGLAGCSHEISPLVDPDAQDEVAFQRALKAYNAMSFEEAQAEFDAFMATFPDSPRFAEGWYLTGRCRYELNHFSDAISTLVEMRATYPDSPFAVNASYYIGRSEYEAHDYSDAEAELSSFEATYPDSEYLDDSRYYLGRTFYDQSRWNDAMPPLQRVLAMDGSEFAGNASYYVGRSLFELTNYHDAIPYFRFVLSDPMNEYCDNAQYYVGRSFYEAGDLEAAVPELQKAETTYPDSDYLAASRYYLGRSFYDRDMWTDAEAPLQRLTVMTGTTLLDDGWFYLARSQYELKDLPNALDGFSTIEVGFATSNYVDNALRYEAQVYTDQKDCTQAKAAVDRLRTQFPDSTELPKATSYLTGHGC